ASGCSVACFLFQAEDGIRDDLVTGVQTCALPILEVALFAGRLEQENVLGRIVSPLRDFAVKRLGLVSSMPGHGHDSIGHVIADARAANDLTGDELEADAAAQNISRPSEPGRAVGADCGLPTVSGKVQGGGALEA